jgi:hypothetical protein
MRKHALAPMEKRLFTVAWALGFAAWLGAGAVFFRTAEMLPWFVISIAGGIVALSFGMAVRYRLHLLPWWWNGERTKNGIGDAA